MAEPIQELYKAANDCFSETLNSETFRQRLNDVKSKLNLIRCEDVNINLEALKRGKTAISYIPICKNNSFSMSIFVLRSDATVPLHDHPDMHGFCKVLGGSAYVRSYTKAPTELDSDDGLLKAVYLREDKSFNKFDDCISFTPVKENFHELMGTEGISAFIDVLSPPYSTSEGRVCSYYKLMKDVEYSNQVSKGHGNIYWMKQIPTPLYYRCEQYKYSGPPVK